MQIQIESTTKIVNLNGVPARIWEGHTASGIPVHCYVTRIAVANGQPSEQFERELQEQRMPSVEVRTIPAALIL